MLNLGLLTQLRADSKMHLDAAIDIGLKQMGIRADAGETAAFTRQLEFIYSQTWDIKYPDLKGRLLLPVDNTVNSGADTFTYRQFDLFGEARVVHNYSSDFPAADINGKEYKQSIVSLGDSYSYSVQDLRAAAFAGVQLEARKAAAARRVIENKIDSMACIGDATTGILGLANAANIQSYTITAGATSTYTTWGPDGSGHSKTPKEILADINAMSNQVFTNTKGIWTADTLILGTKGFAYLSTTPVNQADSSIFLDCTILQYILRSSPWIKNIEYWPRLDTAGASSKERVMLMKRDPDVAQLVIPQEFEQMPPQARNMSFVTSCHARCGGVSVKYPLAICYADGTQV